MRRENLLFNRPQDIYELLKEKQGSDYIESRLARFYASIMREFHFYHLVKESNLFDKVSYSLKQDIEHKIDCLVEKDKESIGIQLRVKTANAKRYAEKKTQRQFEDSGVMLIDVALDFDCAKEVPTKKDSFLFYDVSYIEEIVRELEKREKNHVAK